MSPVHDQSYRRYAGARRSAGSGWAVIAGSGIRNLIRRRVLLGLMILAWLPFVVRTVQIYLVTMYPQAREVLPVNTRMFQQFVEFQGLFAFFLTIYVGSGLIANDRRANALQIYLSKPLARSEYVVGKLVTLLVFLVGVTWVPAMLLLLLQIMFAGSVAFVQRNLFLFPAITLFSLLQVLTSAFAMLALSSMSKSSRFVGIMYAGTIFFTAAFYNAVRAMTGSSAFAWISPQDSLDILRNAIFRVRSGYELSPVVALVAILVIIGGSILILERRVRGVEVVT